MSRPIHFLLFAAVLGALPAAFAADAAPSALTLEEARARTVAHHPLLAAQAHEERAAEARVEQAGQRPAPALEVTLENFAGTGALQGAHSLEATVQASRTLERGGKRDKRVALAGRERAVAAQESRVRRAELRAATTAAYLETLAAQSRLALAAEPSQLAREMVAAVEQRVKAGAASPADSARARAALAATETEWARAEAALRSARARLAAAWGGDPGEVGEVTGEFRVPTHLPDQAALLARLDQHPRLAWQRSQIETRRAALALEQSQAVADVTVGGGLRFLRDGSDAGWVAGISVPLPGRQQNQGNIRAARETLAGAELAVQGVEIELRAAFSAAWQELAVAHRAARSLRAQSLPAMTEAYVAVRHAYDQGQLPLIDVLDAQHALVAVRRDLLDAEVAYALALARLEALAGPDESAVIAYLNPT